MKIDVRQRLVPFVVCLLAFLRDFQRTTVSFSPFLRSLFPVGRIRQAIKRRSALLVVLKKLQSRKDDGSI